MVVKPSKTQLMCHGYKLASLNWCCQLLICSDGKKIWFVGDKYLKFYSCSHKKRPKRLHLRVSGHSWTFTYDKHFSLANQIKFKL